MSTSPTPPRAWERACLAGCALLTWALRLPSLLCPYFLDDLAQHAMLQGRYWTPRAPWDLYRFVGGTDADAAAVLRAGFLPWWTDPQYRLAFLRPLASLSLWFDHRVLGGYALLSHLHSALWWTAGLVALWSLARSLLGPRLALLATLFYSLEESHTLLFSWSAARNSAMSLALGLWALRAQLAWRERGMPLRGALLPLALWTLASLSGEYTLTLLPALLLLELLCPPLPLRARLRALLPPLPGAFLLGIVGRALGYVVRSSEHYIDPLHDLGRFLHHAPERLSSLTAELLWARSIDIDGSPDPSDASTLLLATAVVYGAACAVAWGPLSPRERRVLLGSSLAAPLALVPVLSTVAQTRLVASAMALLAPGLAVACAGFYRGLLRGSPQRRGLALLGLGCLLALHGGRAAMRSREESLVHARAMGGGTAGLDGAQRWQHLQGTFDLVTVNTGDLFSLLYPALRWSRLPGTRVRSQFALAQSHRPLSIRRLDERTLEVGGDAVLDPRTIEFFRTPERPLSAGYVARVGPAELTVLQASQGTVHRFVARFDRDLDAPDLLFLVATTEGLLRVPPPRVGETVSIPPPPLAWRDPFTEPSAWRP